MQTYFQLTFSPLVIDNIYALAVANTVQPEKNA